MVMATGKGGKYRYYKCSARLKRGNAACRSGNVPMERLDNLVLDAFRQKIYKPDHIREVVDALRKQASKIANSDDKAILKALEKDMAEAEQAQNRLYEAIEKGLIEQDDNLKNRFQQHKAKREGLLAEIAALKAKKQSPLQTVTPQKIEAVAKILCKRMEEASPFAKAYLKGHLKRNTHYG